MDEIASSSSTVAVAARTPLPGAPAEPPGHGQSQSRGEGQGPGAGGDGPVPPGPSLVTRLRRHAGRALRLARRLRRPSTPFLLRLGMAVACLPVALFAAAVLLGVARNDGTVRTVGRDAVQGITAAQDLKLHLAELDAIVVERLLEPAGLGESGYPDQYNLKRSQLHENLVLVAAQTGEAAAYQQPLANIEYALAHFHTLAGEAFAARAEGDTQRAADRYSRAHEVMEGTLLSEADFVDKAHTYVLNDTYDRQEARSASTMRLMVVSWLVLLGFLVLVQVLLARRFRRLVNLAVATATLVAAVSGGFALSRLDRSSSALTTAREQAFDSVHVLSRARATLASARQAEGQLLLDPARATQAQTGFDMHTRRLFRVQGRADATDVAELAAAGRVPEGAGGYLARVAAEDEDEAGDILEGGGFGTAGADGAEAGTGRSPTRQTIVAFGAFLEADATFRALVAAGDHTGARTFYREATAFTELSAAVEGARSIAQDRFDRYARSASEAASPVGPFTGVAALAVLLLVVVGLFQRLREYGG